MATELVSQMTKEDFREMISAVLTVIIHRISHRREIYRGK